MTTPPPEELAIGSGDDVVRVRQLVRTAAGHAGMSLVDQTKLITAASELARNTFVYGGGGAVRVEHVVNARGRAGVRIAFSDRGPGIPDVDQALTEGWTSGGGLGLGLSGARRLVDEFELETEVGKGTTVTVTKWTR
ncbi:anti-sigma regulatory factor [Actinomadura parmotrematis]|uniref:Anti-sigma regulatory factor n=1 Tax=Actinomadura parmotrematis TaxID=2864039 RepID=A0ABS7FN95_9ACTN|nr:anti-sigma regulatory factor [Actinomadura parmotrematis]MBW8481859.1 anti-sigma regulatory factor [Actinomadura parmotrematis]